MVGLIGAFAVTAGVLFVRQNRHVEAPGIKEVPAGETHPGTISLERIRELGY